MRPAMKTTTTENDGSNETAIMKIHRQIRDAIRRLAQCEPVEPKRICHILHLLNDRIESVATALDVGEGGEGFGVAEGEGAPTAASEGKRKRVGCGAGEGKGNEVVQYWNSKAALSHVKALSPGRAKHLRARLRDEFFKANWQVAIDRIATSDFCIGKGDSGWVATFDWLLRPDTVAKVMEGKYDNRGIPPGVRRGTRPPPRPGDSGSLAGGDAYIKRLKIAGGEGEA